MGYRPVSAPGVPQQLSEPKTPWQNSSGLAQQGLPQKPRPHAELGMGTKTKTTMAAGQMWSPTPSVWLKGTHGASGKGKPVWTQQYCNRGVTSPCSLGCTSLSPALCPGRELPSLPMSHSPDLHLGHPSPFGNHGGWSPPGMLMELSCACSKQGGGSHRHPLPSTPLLWLIRKHLSPRES